MTKLLVKLSKYLSFWMIFFLLFKVVFLSWNYDQSILLSGGKIVAIFWDALKMDLTSACYLLLLTVLSIGLRFFLKALFINIFVFIDSFIDLIFASLLTMPDHGLYLYFGIRVNKPHLIISNTLLASAPLKLMYMLFPKSISASVAR